MFARPRPRLSNASVIFPNAQATRRGRPKEISDKPAAMLSGPARGIVPHNALRAGRWARETSNRPPVVIASGTEVWARQGVEATGALRRSEEWVKVAVRPA